MNNKFSKPTRNFFIPLFLFGLIFAIPVLFVKAQTDEKRDVAIIIDSRGTRTIKYSDLLFFLALEPGVPVNPPKTEDLKRVFQTIINLSLIAREIESRIPCLIPTEADVTEEIKRVLGLFRSPAEFEQRLKIIGFDSIKDDNFRKMMSAKTEIQKWFDIRFRSFIIFDLEAEEKYYRDVFAPDFRRRNPGLLLPELKQIRPQIRQILEEKRVEGEIQRFLDYARQQVKIEILSGELK